MIGCTWNQGNNQYCPNGYHGYAAIDIARNRTGSIAGGPVYAAGAGLATIYQTTNGCGAGKTANVVQVDHGGGVKSYYYHLGSFAISGPTWVDENTVVGYVGATGYVDPCSFNHLHFEVRNNGTRIDPGQLKACIGTRLTSYPAELGVADWPNVPLWRSVHDDGTACGGGIADGSFISNRGHVYRIAGGAPLGISDCGPLGGCPGLTPVDDQTLASLRSVPADGTFLEEAGAGIYRVAGGAPLALSDCTPFGNGCDHRVAVNHSTIGNLDHLNAVPADGTFLEEAGAGIYRVAGGAPLALSDCTPFGNGCDHRVAVNHSTIVNLDHLNAVPADGTFLEEAGAGIYRVAGGAPLALSDCTPFGNGCDHRVAVNHSTIVNLDHLNAVPADGTFLEEAGAGIYRVAGGAPLALSDCTPFGNGCDHRVAVNHSTIVNLDHLNAVPADGTFLEEAGAGIYRVAGGAPLALSDCTPFGNGCDHRVAVNHSTIVNLDHLNAVPADGTVLHGLPSNTYWAIKGGQRFRTAAANSAVGVNDTTILTLPLRITISSVSPSSVARGAVAKVLTVTGANFKAGIKATFSGTGIKVITVKRLSSTKVTVTITVASSAAKGARSLILRNTDAGNATKTNAITIT